MYSWPRPGTYLYRGYTSTTLPHNISLCIQGGEGILQVRAWLPVNKVFCYVAPATVELSFTLRFEVAAGNLYQKASVLKEVVL